MLRFKDCLILALRHSLSMNQTSGRFGKLRYLKRALKIVIFKKATSHSAENVQILRTGHNLAKSAKII